MSGAASAIAIGAAVGAAVGGVSAAINGGDIGLGILGGAAGGALTGGIASPLSGALGGGLAGSIGGGLIAGAAGGALNSAITGGDLASGTLMGGLMGGVMGGFNYSSGPSINADGSVGAGAQDITGAGAPSVDASGGAAGQYNQPVATGYGSGGELQGPTQSGLTLDTATGTGQIAAPASPLAQITAQPLAPPGTNLDTSQLAAAQQIVATQGPNSPALAQFPPEVQAAALQTTGAPAGASATTAIPRAPSMGPAGGAYDSVGGLTRGVINTNNAANNWLYSKGYGGVQPEVPLPTQAAANAPAPWGNTGVGVLDKGLNWVQNNKGLAAMGGLGVLSMLGGSGGQPAQAAPAAASMPTSKYWNTPLPQYTGNRTVTPAPTGYQPYKQGEWLYFPAQQPTPVAMAKGGRVASSKGGLGALGTGRRLPPGGQDDRVPAVLAKDEYVVPADVVAHIGDGSSNAGGARLDHMVKSVRSHKASAGSKFPPRAKSPLAYMKG